MGRAATARNETVTNGTQAWRRLRGRDDWEDWQAVIRALVIGRQSAMRTASANEPVGRRYNSAFSSWLSENGFSGIGRATRAACLNCSDHLDRINEMRAEWVGGDRRDGADQLRVNHPQSVWQRFRRVILGIQPGRRKRGGQGRPSTRNTFRDALASLDVGEIAATYVAEFGQQDARELLTALANETDTRVLAIADQSPTQVGDWLRQLFPITTRKVIANRLTDATMPTRVATRPTAKKAARTRRRAA